MNLTFSLLTLSIGHLKRLINTSEMCKQYQHLSICWFFFYNFHFFYHRANLTLNFYLLTLTLGQLKHLNNVSNMYK